MNQKFHCLMLFHSHKRSARLCVPRRYARLFSPVVNLFQPLRISIKEVLDDFSLDWYL